MRLRTLIKAATVAALALAPLSLVTPAQAAPTWTTLASGTTEEITGVEYRADRIVFATAGGKIFSGPPSGPFAQVLSQPGVVFNDIALNPSGTLGLAVGNNGRLARFNGAVWSMVDGTALAASTYDFNGATPGQGDCHFSAGGPYGAATPTSNLRAVAWATDAEAYVVSDAEGTVLKTTNGGMNFADASRLSNGTCKIRATIDDVATVPGLPGYAWFGTTWFGEWFNTTDGLASPGAPHTGTMANCYSVPMSIAVDPANTGRVSVAAGCADTLHWGYTGNGGASRNYVSPGSTALYDLAVAGGTFIAVGDGGAVLRTSNGQLAESIGNGTTTGWRAVDMLDASRVVVGGTSGSLVISANAHESLTAPTPGTTPAATFPSESPVVGGAVKTAGPIATMKVRGSLGVPAGVDRAKACTGSVTLVVKKGKRKIAKSSAALKPDCRYAKKIKIKRSKLAGAKKVTLVVSFPGNAALGKSQQSYSVKVR